MHLHLLSQDESYVNCIEMGPHVTMKAATGTGASTASGAATGSGDATGRQHTIPKTRSEWTLEDIAEVHKDKKAMNILFNSLDGDMFKNVINCSTAKEI